MSYANVPLPLTNEQLNAGRAAALSYRRRQSSASQHPGGWRNYHGRFFGRFYEAFLILRGTHSLHRAWQAGYDRHIQDESARRTRGGK